MTDTRLSIDTPDGPMDAYLAVPDDSAMGGPARRRPGLVVLQEAFGVNEHIRDVCRRFARAGYVALAPEVYHRVGKGFEVPYTAGPRAMELLATLTNDGLTTDLAAALAALRADPRVDSAHVGIVGFCAGGFAAFLGACRLDPAAVVVFYGGGIVRPREGMAIAPVLAEADAITAPVLCLFGSADGGIPPADVEAIRARLAGVGAMHEVVVYEGAKHAFFNDLRPANYDAVAANAAWGRALAWCARSLAPVEG
jgi:carboxymethylenebutenolidase